MPIGLVCKPPEKKVVALLSVMDGAFILVTPTAVEPADELLSAKFNIGVSYT